MDSLPEEARRLVLRNLPAPSLCACQSVCHALKESASCDEIWQTLCQQHWRGARLGQFVRSYQECYRSANGWANLRSVPRAIAYDAQNMGAIIPWTEFLGPKRQRILHELTAFDATEATFVAASAERAYRYAFHFESCGTVSKLEVSLGGYLYDLRLLPHAEETPSALALVNDLSIHGSEWTSRLQKIVAGSEFHPVQTSDLEVLCTIDGKVKSFELSGTSHAIGLGASRSGAACRMVLADLATGQTVSDAILGGQSSSTACDIRNMCHMPRGGGSHEATVALRQGRRSILVHADFREANPYVLSLAMPHENIMRVRCHGGGTGALTSFARSKEILLWDLRAFGTDVGDPVRAQAPAVAFRCSGNAPDFHSSEGIVCGISGGPPGTTYGAKLHVFSTTPHKVEVDVVLPEVVIDEGHRRHGKPQGVVLAGRSLTVMLDSQRLLRCWVP